MNYPQFPKGFVFGAATSAYQIEGGHDADGKGASIWDTFVVNKGKIGDGQTGDVACDTYNNFQTDVDIMSQLKMTGYRFSTSWSRVMPKGKGEVNAKGLDYYKRLVDALLEKNIDPYITLYHWDMPQALYEENKGFAHRDTAKYFADYSRVMVQALGDRVNNWITLNEPWEHAMMGYFLGTDAPGHKNPKLYFKTVHHQLLGHGLALKAMRSTNSDLNIGITLSQFPLYSNKEHPNKRDLDSVEFADMFVNRFFLDGIFKGEYPKKLMKKMWPIKPKVMAGDMEAISGKIDFLGVNYYSPLYAQRKWYIPLMKTWIDQETPDYMKNTDPTIPGYPDGFRVLSKMYREDYGNPPVYITENGTRTRDVVKNGRVADTPRIDYMTHYLTALQKAIEEGGDIRGCFAWTLMDNFEWRHGNDFRMGLVHTDFDTRERTIKDSGYWFRDMIISQRG